MGRGAVCFVEVSEWWTEPARKESVSGKRVSSARYFFLVGMLLIIAYKSYGSVGVTVAAIVVFWIGL